MMEERQEVRHCRGVGQLRSENLKHPTGTLGVHMDLVVLLGQFFLVLHPHHLEEVQVPVESLVLVPPQLLYHGLHQSEVSIPAK